MLSAVTLADGGSFTLTAVACAQEHRDWSEVEVQQDVRLVLVRRGRFRRQADGLLTDVDPTVAYLGSPGEEERFAHPTGGDRCTSISIVPTLWRTLAGEQAAPVQAGVYVDARLELAHRRLLAAARTGDTAFEVAEELLGMIASTVARVVDRTTPAAGAARAGRAALVARAREAIVAGHPAAEGLLPLAALLGVSPYRLSRAFTADLGVSLTWYRNRVRVGQALGRLADGEDSLAVLAADLGFADQAHFTRTIRAHLGHTPTAVRRLLHARQPAQARG
ncbi:helix-turn-helix domain-containing protein [Pseudonocardia kunmingensis]|uniref:AraC-like DNA-binding protein n=1 Tax=Pseudonocardia kunmingensis TaxID=630975 RepID=A0A543CYY9_9PSEU|nr:AraC family transcriptional regulator [Pseudonocardia kunmingensis]TQM02305.1 AraC-like DNA-binding protein [Pseudonocardia kunmingensis]